MQIILIYYKSKISIYSKLLINKKVFYEVSTLYVKRSVKIYILEVCVEKVSLSLRLKRVFGCPEAQTHAYYSL